MNIELAKQKLESMKIKPSEDTFRLRGTIIKKGKNGYFWLEYGNIYSDTEITELYGRAYIVEDADVLILGNWKASFSISESWEEVDEYIDAQNPWTRTKYYMKIYDIGNAHVFYCDSGEEVDDTSVLDRISSIVFKPKEPITEEQQKLQQQQADMIIQALFKD